MVGTNFSTCDTREYPSFSEDHSWGRPSRLRKSNQKIFSSSACLDPPVPFYLLLGQGSPTKIDYRQKGTLILTSLLEDLAVNSQVPGEISTAEDLAGGLQEGRDRDRGRRSRGGRRLAHLPLAVWAGCPVWGSLPRDFMNQSQEINRWGGAALFLFRFVIEWPIYVC